MLLVILGLSVSTRAEENENTIEVQSPKKEEVKMFIPIESSPENRNIKNGITNENSENVPAVGESKILMVVGHPKNDKVRNF